MAKKKKTAKRTHKYGSKEYDEYLKKMDRERKRRGFHGRTLKKARGSARKHYGSKLGRGLRKANKGN